MPFTDLCRFHGQLYLTFRSCPDGHTEAGLLSAEGLKKVQIAGRGLCHAGSALESSLALSLGFGPPRFSNG